MSDSPPAAFAEEPLPPMRFWVRVLFAPFLLCLIAVNQIRTAQSSLLSPWKGGGFGMFSTVDAPPARSVLAWLITEAGEIPLKIPENFLPLKNRLATSPTPERAEELASLLAARSWVREDVRWRKIARDSRTPSEAGGVTSAVLRPRTPLADQPPLDVPGLEPAVTSGRGFPDERLAVQAVRVEVWFRTFDSQNKRLAATKRLEAVRQSQRATP